MNRWLSVLLQWALMALVSAFLFVELFKLNGLLFSQLAHMKRINWLFLPAGIRVLLVLTMDVPAALGIALATLWLNRELLSEQLLPLVCIGLVSGFGPWLVKSWMQARGLLDRDLLHLNTANLLHFVLVYSAVNAVLHQLLFWGFSMHDSKPWLDVWPMFFGDLAGAMIVLYVFKLGLSWYHHRAQPKG